MAYIDKSSQWFIKKETSYGDRAGFNNLDSAGVEVAPVAADFVELINPTMDASTEMIDREVLKNSMVMAQPLLGKETCSGSVEVEASSATGIAAAKLVNGDLLYESALGKRIGDLAATAGTIASGVIAFTAPTDADAYTVGQAVIVSGGAGVTEYGVVRSIVAGVSMTISPAPADDHVLFGGMVSFVIANPSTAQISLAIQEYFEGTSQSVYTYGGVVVSDVSISYPVANIVKSNFSLAGAGFDVANDSNATDTVAVRTAQCTDLAPYVAKNMSFTYNDVAYAIEDLEVKVSSDIYDTEALTTDGLTNKTATGKSEVGGTFGLEYTGTTLFDIFQAGTAGELFGTVTNATTTALVYAPKVILTEASKSVDSGIYKEAISYTCLSSGLACGTEDAITIAFG